MRNSRLDPRAMQSMQEAHDMAVKNGHDTYGTDDWIRAFVDNPTAVWMSVNDEFRRLSGRIVSLYGGYVRFDATTKELPKGDALKAAISRALFIFPGRDGTITRNHIMWGILDTADNAGTNMLKAAGVNIATLRENIGAGIDAGIGAE